MADRRQLEEDFAVESRVFVGLYGSTYRAQMQWARRVMPAEAADHYMESWWEGRQSSLRYLHWMAENLRKQGAGGDDVAAWLDRFTATPAANVAGAGNQPLQA